MKNSIIQYALLLLGASSTAVSASHVVSGTTARLPMSLSTVINDLEAEGVSYVTTAAFLSSKSVRATSCAKLLRSLFGVSAEDEEDVTYGSTMAFGKKLGNEAAATTAEAENSDEEVGGSGVAIACPPASGTVSEVCSTVVACGGTVVYVADPVDLGRGEGLFHNLGPAIERLLASRAQAAATAEEGGKVALSRPSTLIVVFSGTSTKAEVATARKSWEQSAAKMLQSIIQPSQKAKATKLEDIFDRIEYLSDKEKDVDMHLCPAGGMVGTPESPSSLEPSEVAGGVRDVIEAGLVENLGPIVEASAKVPVKQACPRLTNPVDLAAARLLGPKARSALDDCLNTIQKSAGPDGTKLVSEYGALAHAAIHRALDDFDAAATSFKKSPVAKRIRNDLRINLYSELSDVYDIQVSALKSISFDAFRGRLNKLRITPNLATQMDEAAQASVAEFTAAVKKLRPPKHDAVKWASTSDQISSFANKCREHNAERLKAARASGQFRPLPRKGITVGFHWLLPKPFGNDYRQEPKMMHTADDLVYAPVDGITDVSGMEIRSGDWRKGVVPAPSGSEMMYLK